MTDDPAAPPVDLADVVGADVVPLSVGSIPVIRVGEAVHIVFRHATESIGLDYRAALRIIRTRSWATVVVTTTVARDGRQLPMVTVDARTFLMFLATLSEHRVSETIRPKLVAYQCEMADAIDAYARRGVAVNPRGRSAADVAVLEDLARVGASGVLADLNDLHYHAQVADGRRDGADGRPASTAERTEARRLAVRAGERAYARIVGPALRAAGLDGIADPDL